MAMTIVETTRPVTGGVDTHLDVHVAAAVDATGGVLGVESFATTPAGYVELHGWLAGFGTVVRVGVEGTGAYGAGLARHLRGRGLVVIEVDRPNRQERRRNGKSDVLDAIEAARAALSGRASGIAKSADGDVEAIRALLVARRSARDVRIKYLNQIRHLGFTAPDELRERLRGVPREHLARTAASLRPAPTAGSVMHATKSRSARWVDGCWISRRTVDASMN
jgi:transposase